MTSCAVVHRLFSPAGSIPVFHRSSRPAFVPVLRGMVAGPVNAILMAEIVIFMKPTFRQEEFSIDDIKIGEFCPSRYRYLPSGSTGSSGRVRHKSIHRRGENDGARAWNVEVKLRPQVRRDSVMMRAAPCQQNGKGPKVESMTSHDLSLTSRIEFSPPKSSFSRARIVGSGIRRPPSMM